MQLTQIGPSVLAARPPPPPSPLAICIAAGNASALDVQPAGRDVDGAVTRGGAVHRGDSGRSAREEVARERFTQVVLPYLPDAYSLARSLSGNRADAEDIVQEACLQAFRALANTVVSNGRAYLLTIVHHTAYRWLRKNKPTALVTVDNLEEIENLQPRGPSEQTPETALIVKSDELRLEEAIQALPPLFREPLILRDIEGLSYREIAEVTGTPIGTVMSRLARARNRLVEVLSKAAP
ncbi:sigma-70 family RNA polymerase sigma factor [Terrarubrum flagellatum]|uniref:sigma-70 family RNA polymerase sigma factor n=1 Tax=Terrirubrum flagellatum TaxID=2895980 RepID=UPI003145654F